MFIIQSGMVDIIMTDGYDNHQVLDVLGKDSIMGNNIVLKGDLQWPFAAINNTHFTTKVIMINYNLINYMKLANP